MAAPNLATSSQNNLQAQTMASSAVNVPTALLEVYEYLLPNNSKAICFVFGSRLSDVLQAPAEHVATVYSVTKEDAVEEFKRLMAIKTYMVDDQSDNLSPTPLSMPSIDHFLVHANTFNSG